MFNDLLSNPTSNDIVAEMIREKIRATVVDPETAEALCPKDHPFGSKRPCLDTNYFETYNLPHVRLVDLRQQPIVSITETGIETSDETFEFDAIVYATGFDAMTGPVVAVDIRGRDGLSLREKWADGPSTYLGLTTVGFPNFFTITGPGSPSVLSNMAVSIEQHVDWVAACLDDLRARGFETIEPTPLAEAGWNQHVDDGASITLYPTANSWYMGANVPGKPRAFLPYVAGVDNYRAACDEVVARDYLGFSLAGPAGSQCNDGVICRLQVDVALLIKTMEELDLPPMESLPVEDARALMQAIESVRPPGRAVGEVVDGVLPGAAGELAYRLYRPATRDPIPSSPTSTAAAGCSAAWIRTTRSAATCAAAPMPWSCRSTTGTRQRPASRRRPTTRSPPCSGSPPMPQSSGASPISSRWRDGARVPTSRPWPASWPGTPVDPTSSGSCC